MIGFGWPDPMSCLGQKNPRQGQRCRLVEGCHAFPKAFNTNHNASTVVTP